MPNTLTSIFVSNPATEPVEAPHPNTGVYVTGTQATVGGPWTVVHTLITKTATPLTMVGRLKNFPAVTVSVVASGGPNAGNIFNNVPAAPVGISAAGTTLTSISVTASTSPNGLANRILASSAAGGPFVQVYQGATSGYSHNVASGAVQYYQYQYVGAGFYDDSPVSAVFSGAANTTRKILYLSLGDSITQGDQQGGVAGGNTFPQRAKARLDAAAPGVFTLQQQGYPGKSAAYFINNALTTTLAGITAANWDAIIVLVEFGANDLTPQAAGELHTVAGVTGYMNQLADSLRAFSPKVKVVYYPIANRTDSYTTATFDADRRAVNNAVISGGTTHFDEFANLTDEPLLYGTSATTNTTYFVDQVHRTIAGADIDGRAAARAIARLAGVTIAEGNLVTPTAADTSKYPAAAAGLPANSVVWADLQNSAYSTTTGVLSKIGGDAWNGHATAVKLPVVGSVWSATVGKPATSNGSIVSFASAKAAVGQTSIGSNILLYWDGAVIRIFQNGGLLLETPFANASYVLSMTVTATGFQYKRDGVLLIPEVAATTSGPLYLNAELYNSPNSFIPVSTLV